MRDLATGIAAVVLLVAPAVGRDIYVNNRAGDDRYSGSQPRSLNDATGPVRSIAKALRLASPGDRIVLADSGKPYHESVSLVGSRMSGLSLQPLVIDGNGAVLDGSAPVPSDRWEFFRDNAFRFRPARMGRQMLFLDGRPAPQVAVSPTASAPPKLDPRQWCSHEGYIYFGADTSKLPGDYALTHACLPTGITLYHVDHIVIKDLTIQGFLIDGVNAQNSARRVVLNQVTCMNNGLHGVAVGGASQVDLEGCTIYGNGAAQLLTLPYSEVHLRNSDLRGDTAPAWADQGGRVYLGGRLAQGGLEAIQRGDSQPKPDEAKPSPGAEKPKP